MQAIHAADAIWSRTLGRIINGQALIIVEDERQAALAVKWERRKACLRLSFELRKESCCVKMMIMKEYVHVNTWIHLAMASSVSIGWNCRSCCQSISCCCSGAQPDGNMAMMKKCAATMGNKMANVKQQSQSLSNHAKLEKARREDDILTGDLSLLWCKQKYLSIYAIVQWENFSVLILFAFFSTPTLNMDDIFSCNTAHCTLY